MNKHKREEKRDNAKEHSPYTIFLGVGLVAIVCFMLLFVGIGVASATDYYVSLSGNDANDGLTLGTAWQTITYAATQAQAGDTVHIKGGNYGHEHVVIKNSGTASKPIVFEGYDGAPVINGQDDTGIGIHVRSKDYIVLKNFKITRYRFGVYLEGAEHITLDNITVIDWGTDKSRANIMQLGIYLSRSHHCIVRDCSVTDARYNIQLLQSNYNLIENCASYGIRTYNGDGNDIATGYYIVILWGHENTVRNCLAHNMHGPVDVHRGHGILIKDDPGQGITHSYNNKIIDCECHAIAEPFAVIWGAHDNEFINCRAYRDNLLTCANGGLVASYGSYNNTFKNCRAKGFKLGIGLEVGTNENNTFSNCIISDSSYGIRLYDAENNKFKNCVITGAGTLFQFENEKGNSLTNCIITDIPDWSQGSGNPTVTYSDFWNNGFSTPSGTGNMAKDPLFADPTNDDFHLKSQYGRWDGSKWVYDTVTSPCIDAGDPSDDYGNEPLPNGGRINMEAYGNTGEASKSYGEISTGTISGTAGLF